MMPTWHTSPFSEYIMYFQWAMHRFPSHIRIYDNEQIGAAPDEIPSNYFMTNGVGLIEACGLKAFSAASLIAKHELSLQYCKDRSGKKKDSCKMAFETSFHEILSSLKYPKPMKTSAL